jgi:transcriptional regulator with XRE-family HTH domain
MTAADRLHDFLTRHGVTRREAAEALGIPTNTLLPIASGHRYPSPELAARIEAYTAGQVPVASWPRLATGKHFKPRLNLAQRLSQTRFSEWLDRHGISRSTAAGYLDVSLSTLHRWCRGDMKPPAGKIAEIEEWTRGEITASTWEEDAREKREVGAYTGMMVYGPK